MNTKTLINAFKSFRILNRDTKFLSKFFVGSIWRQIKSIKADNKTKTDKS